MTVYQVRRNLQYELDGVVLERNISEDMTAHKETECVNSPKNFFVLDLNLFH